MDDLPPRMHTKIPLFAALVVLFLHPLHVRQQMNREAAERHEEMLVQTPAGGPAFEKLTEWYATEGGGMEKVAARRIPMPRRLQPCGKKF